MKSILKILIIFICILIFYRCRQDNNNEQIDKKIVKVKVDTLHFEYVSFPIRTIGKLSASSEKLLSFRTGGIINTIHVKGGQKVKKGKVLAKLKLTEIKAQVDMYSEAYEKAKRDFTRAENLYHDSVATLEQYQNAKTALEVAKSNLDMAEFNLQYSKITAPSQGRILKILKEENEMVGSGMPVLLFGAQSSSWIVKANITDKDIVKVGLNDSVSMYFDAYQGTSFYGEVNEIGGFADPYTGTYELEIKLLDNQDKKLASGFLCKLEIYPKNKRKLLSVSIDAVFDMDNRTGYLYEWVKGGAKKHKVELLKIAGDRVYIKSDLKEDDVIISENIEKINEDVKIEIVNK